MATILTPDEILRQQLTGINNPAPPKFTTQTLPQPFTAPGVTAPVTATSADAQEAARDATPTATPAQNLNIPDVDFSSIFSELQEIYGLRGAGNPRLGVGSTLFLDGANLGEFIPQGVGNGSVTGNFTPALAIPTGSTIGASTNSAGSVGAGGTGSTSGPGTITGTIEGAAGGSIPGTTIFDNPPTEDNPGIPTGGPGPGVGGDPGLPDADPGDLGNLGDLGGPGGIYGPTASDEVPGRPFVPGGAEQPRNVAGEVPRIPSLRSVRRHARRRSAAGFSGQTDTILTSGQGVQGPANTLQKVLLGA